MLKDKLKYFFKNQSNDKVFSTSDETLFVQKQDALAHARTLEDSKVLEHLKSGSVTVEDQEDDLITTDHAGLQRKAQEVAQNQLKDAAKQPTPAELKAAKDKAVSEYKEVFEEEPDTKLTAAKISELTEAKKAELANIQNPE
ncbi:hypothetical protein [Chryseobacterium sp. KCF3-3]|uniref:hypothetical protein n=1 Tax=Chryseobacterium sp. KCF3-3 TaxID=3231511 RepID=UPI0038B262F7